MIIESGNADCQMIYSRKHFKESNKIFIWAKIHLTRLSAIKLKQNIKRV